jgi:hypothetical protein|tara:strand:- start:874 stop:1107 length:234 start_codon:yes stop_codon:yes gene_type:complete
MGFLDVFAIEVNDGQLLRENDSVRVDAVDALGDLTWDGTVNGITVFDGVVEVTVTNQDGEDIQVDSGCISVNETQGW